MDELSKMLKDSQCSLVVSKDGKTATYNGSGLRPLLQLLDNAPRTLSGAQVADKVVGKAAASVMVAAGVKGVYTPLISKPALAMLTAHNIHASYDSLVPNILNRDKSALCPLEKATQSASTPQQALAAIRQAILRMQKKSYAP